MMMKLLKNKKGVQYIEYALLAALISVALIQITKEVKDGIKTKLTTVKTELNAP